MNNKIPFLPSIILKKENPILMKYSKEILFNEVWMDESLSSRERSLITLSILASIGNTEQLDYHIKVAYGNNLTKRDLIALTTHLAFYIGWPLSMQLLNKIIQEN